MRVRTIRNPQQRRRSHRMHKQTFLLLIAVFLLVGCDKNTLMHSYQPLKDNSWDRADTIRFTLPALAQDDNCSMLVGLRLNNRYPYEQLVLQVEQVLQHPTAHRLDTVYYQLTNERGDFTEEGVDYFQYETEGLPLDLKKGQTGEIKIRHLMHREVLPGITDVGIHIIR